MSSNVKRFSIGLLIVSVIVGLVASYIFLVKPYFITKAKLKLALAQTVLKNIEDKTCLDIQDYWGQPICIKRQEIEGDKRIKYIAYSHAWDGFESFDDISDSQNVDPSISTRIRVKMTVKYAKKEHISDGTCLPGYVDYWDNPICIERTKNSDNTEIYYTASSAGWDQEQGTADDVNDSATDHNKSKKVGKWVTKKGKQFFKGMVGEIFTKGDPDK